MYTTLIFFHASFSKMRDYICQNNIIIIIIFCVVLFGIISREIDGQNLLQAQESADVSGVLTVMSLGM